MPFLNGCLGRVRKPLQFAIPALTTFGVDASQANFSSNRYANELAGNGIYSFFAAYRHNEIDHARYYALQNNERVFQHLRASVAEPDTHFVSTDTHNITRTITGRGPEKRLNVMLITVESLSAEFLGAYGTDRKISPHLDALSRESLFFTHVYATGTRTDRGLESIALSVPPTAGRPLIKRPHKTQVN